MPVSSSKHTHPTATCIVTAGAIQFLWYAIVISRVPHPKQSIILSDIHDQVHGVYGPPSWGQTWPCGVSTCKIRQGQERYMNRWCVHLQDMFSARRCVLRVRNGAWPGGVSTYRTCSVLGGVLEVRKGTSEYDVSPIIIIIYAWSTYIILSYNVSYVYWVLYRKFHFWSSAYT